MNEHSNGSSGTPESSATHDLNRGNAVHNVPAAVQLDCSRHFKAPPDCKERIFTLSAFDEAGIQRLADTYHEHLLAKSLNVYDEVAYLDDLSFTLFSKRTLFPWRICIVAESIGALIKSSARQSPTLPFQPLKVLLA